MYLLEGQARFLSLTQLNQDWRGLRVELCPEELEQIHYWNPQTVGSSIPMRKPVFAENERVYIWMCNKRDGQIGRPFCISGAEKARNKPPVKLGVDKNDL